MPELPRLHPASRAVLPVLMVVAFVAGVITLNADGIDHDNRRVWGLFWFGWFLAAFMLQGAAWLMREHELWRRELRERSDASRCENCVSPEENG
ncbi:hypothetical protein [Krasilnikovia sp. MM14-A1004]|uniref:hypothetical protein n=1 Tax=Krasilnikovia sp. MM14-A1004 TaxID=3373541 RepID=UPI00399CCE14